MEKHENMVIRNRQTSQAKVEKAIAAMNKMFSNDEQVVVCTLVKKTGLSRAFFYNNEAAPQKVVINKAMDKEIDLLKKKLAEKDAIIAQQNAEIQKLKKATQANLVSTLKEL